MSSIPSCRVVMERWQPHERTPQQIIARKLIAFDFRVLRMVNRGDARSARLTQELIELVKELPESTGAPEQRVSVEDLPLERLRAIERIIDDCDFSISRRAVAIQRLMMELEE